MDTYKLTYFNLRGIAEPIRLFLVYLDIPFENIQLESKDWYEKLQAGTKWGQLPFLEYNGKILTQTTAIMNFLSDKHNLTPEDAWDKAKCEEVAGACHDLRILMKGVILPKYAGDLETAEKCKQELLNSKVPLFLKNLNEVLQEIRESKKSEGTIKSDFILGGEKPTAADFCLAHYTDQWTTFLEVPDLIDDCELLKKQQKAVYSLPRVDKYIETRPETFI